MPEVTVRTGISSILSAAAEHSTVDNLNRGTTTRCFFRPRDRKLPTGSARLAAGGNTTDAERPGLIPVTSDLSACWLAS